MFTKAIRNTSIKITEHITKDGKKVWSCLNENGKRIYGQLAYKAFNSDWTCRRMQYEVGKSFEEDVKPNACWNHGPTCGLHYCVKPADIFNYYSFNQDTKIALVLAYGDVCSREDEDKACTNKLFVIREIPRSEFLVLANEGKDNTGLRNTGNRNTGNRNTGDSNTGNRNTGNRNTGDSNTGDSNTGDSNFGSRCTGDYNIADDSSGVFCTEKHTIKIFDEDSGLTLEQWRNTEAYSLLYRVNHCPTEWVYASDMTDEEKKEHPDYENMNGYLKYIGYDSMRFVKWWNNLSDNQKRTIMNIPNFNPEKFRKITGIDVNNPDHHTRCYRTKFQLLEVGTKVRITITDSYVGPFGKNSTMVALSGQIATITEIKRRSDDPTMNNYGIDLDDGYWNWSCMMFELCDD